MIGVIGDIHGCYHTLLQLMQQIKEKYGEIELFCVGDLVDRGAHSQLVLDYCIEHKIQVTLGNHDCMFLYAFKYPSHPYRSAWVMNGNYETLRAYADSQEDFRKHISYLESLPLFYNLPDCFISHAGISVLYESKLSGIDAWENADWRNFLSTEMERDIGVLWNRSILCNIGKLQVVGHTRQPEVTYTPHSNALYIDTAACAGNRLSCVLIDRGAWVDTLSVQTDLRDLHLTTI